MGNITVKVGSNSFIVFNISSPLPALNAVRVDVGLEEVVLHLLVHQELIAKLVEEPVFEGYTFLQHEFM